MAKRKRGLKKRGYYKFNKGTLILLVGVILLITALLLIQFIGAVSLLINLRLISYILIYLGVITHLIFSGDKPFFKSWKYIKETRNFIYFSILIFFIFALVGFVFPNFFRQEIMDFITELLDKTQNLNQFELIKFIFLNNLQSSFMGLIFGIFFGIFPMLILIINGYLLGVVSSMSVTAGGFSVLWKLVPHGIFELIAVFISLGMGIKIGAFVFQKNKSIYIKYNLYNSLRVFILIIIPLLIIAAIIEGTLITFFG